MLAQTGKGKNSPKSRSICCTGKPLLGLELSDGAFMMALLFQSMQRGLCDMCENLQLWCEYSQLKLDFHSERTFPSFYWSDSSQERTNSIRTDFLHVAALHCEKSGSLISWQWRNAKSLAKIHRILLVQKEKLHKLHKISFYTHFNFIMPLFYSPGCSPPSRSGDSFLFNKVE